MGLQSLQGYDKANSEVLIDPESSDEIHQAIVRLYKKGLAIVEEGKRAGKPAVVAFAVYYRGHGT